MGSLSSADNEGWGHLCLAVKNILLPYIQIALNAVFPPEKIQSITGVKNSGTSENFCLKTILEPIVSFIPITKNIDEPIENSSESATEFVKDRMGEIAAAIDENNEVNEVSKSEEVVDEVATNLEKVQINEEDDRK